MSYDDRKDIDTATLQAGWGVSHQMIGGLLTAAQQNKTIQGELMEGYGYTPEDFPDWWYRGSEGEGYHLPVH